MSDKPVRTIEQIQQEYQSLCLKAGHLQYQVFTFGKDLALVNDTLRDLNLEASALQAKQAEEAKAAEPAAEVK